MTFTLICILGYDEFGYSIRSKKGTVFHKSKGKSYMKNKVRLPTSYLPFSKIQNFRKDS